MGQYVDSMDNLVEALLEVIPGSFLSSSFFEQEIQKSQYNGLWKFLLGTGFTITESLQGKDAVQERCVDERPAATDLLANTKHHKRPVNHHSIKQRQHTRFHEGVGVWIKVIPAAISRLG